MISSSGFSYEKAIEGTKSVPKSINIQKTALKGKGIYTRIRIIKGKVSTIL
jgi:hypothetical protein